MRIKIYFPQVREAVREAVKWPFCKSVGLLAVILDSSLNPCLLSCLSTYLPTWVHVHSKHVIIHFGIHPPGQLSVSLLNGPVTKEKERMIRKVTRESYYIRLGN